MFSKSRRFLENNSCAPPVGTYNIPNQKKASLVSFQKSQRWDDGKEDTLSVSTGPTNASIDSSSPSQQSFAQVKTPALQSTCKKKRTKSFVKNIKDSDVCRKSLEADVEFQQSKVNALLEKIKNLEIQLQDTMKHSDEIEESNVKLHGLLDGVRSEKKELKQKNNNLEEMILKVNADYKIVECSLLQERESLAVLKKEHKEYEHNYEVETFELREKLRIAQELNCDFREQLESIEHSMTDSMKGLSEKYECLEKTFDQVQNDYKNRLERSSSLVEKTRTAHENCQYDLETMNQVYKDLKENNEKILNELEERDAKVAELVNVVKDLEVKLSTVSTQLNEERNEQYRIIQETNEEKDSLKEQLEKQMLISQEAEKSHQIEMANLLRVLDEKQYSLDEMMTLNRRLQEETTTLKTQSLEFSENIKILHQEVKQTVDASKQKDERINRLLENVDENEKQIDALTRENVDLREDFNTKSNNLKSQLSDNEAKLQFTNEQLQRKEKSYSCLEEESAKLKTNISSLEEANKKLSEKVSEIEELKLLPNTTNVEDLQKLQTELDMWKEKYELLENKVSPFMAQLNEFEIERQSLLNEKSFTQQEMETLSRKYAQILGHQNNKQKIHHIEKLKQENLNLKTEVMKLRASASKNKLKLANSEKRSSKFDPSKAFQHSGKENVKQPLREANS